MVEDSGGQWGIVGKGWCVLFLFSKHLQKILKQLLQQEPPKSMIHNKIDAVSSRSS